MKFAPCHTRNPGCVDAFSRVDIRFVSHAYAGCAFRPEYHLQRRRFVAMCTRSRDESVVRSAERRPTRSHSFFKKKSSSFQKNFYIYICTTHPHCAAPSKKIPLLIVTSIVIYVFSFYDKGTIPSQRPESFPLDIARLYRVRCNLRRGREEGWLQRTRMLSIAIVLPRTNSQEEVQNNRDQNTRIRAMEWTGRDISMRRVLRNRLRRGPSRNLVFSLEPRRSVSFLVIALREYTDTSSCFFLEQPHTRFQPQLSQSLPGASTVVHMVASTTILSVQASVHPTEEEVMGEETVCRRTSDTLDLDSPELKI